MGRTLCRIASLLPLLLAAVACTETAPCPCRCDRNQVVGDLAGLGDLGPRLDAVSEAKPAGAGLRTSGHKILDADNKEVYLRGLGRAGDLDSATGNWGGVGNPAFSYGHKWMTDQADLKRRMDETLQSMRSHWHANAIRVFVAVDWWWDDTINPQKLYGEGPDQTFSYRDYWELLAQRAQAAGVYVLFVPYSVMSYYGTSANGGDSGGQPGALSAPGAVALKKIHAEEVQAWRLWWQSVVARLGKYPNVIWETWNEPDGEAAAKAAFFAHVIDIYKTIRATGSKNLFLAQWHMGAVPGWQEELGWVPELHKQLRAAIGGSEPANVVYSTHAYRHAPPPNLSWGTSYSAVLAQLSGASFVQATRSGGIDVPLIIGETGVMMDLTGQELTDDLGWWSGLLRASRELEVGIVAYYWMQTKFWEWSEALIEQPGNWQSGAPSPTPNQAGQAFIDAFK